VVLARAAEREKRHDDAIEHAQDALELNPGDRSAAALLAKAHSAVGSQEEAATRWRAFTRESPDSLRAWTRTIRAEAKAEHWPQVLDTIQKASQATGAAEPWEELRARALLECGRIDELKQSLRALARTNLEKTLRIIWRAAAGEDVALTAGLLKALDLRRLESEPPSRTLRNIQRMLEERVPALTGRDLQETTLSELVDLAVGSSQPRAADNAAVHR
jgi:tetratricopeptide (TPR) repeat protein